MLRIATLLWLAALAHVSPIEVNLKEISATGSKKYVFTNNGIKDERFAFTASAHYSFRLKADAWNLWIVQTADGVPFGDYLSAIRAAIDRFRRDAPDTIIGEVHFYITEESPMWAELKTKLIPLYKRESGRVYGLPKTANDVVFDYIEHSDIIRTLSLDIADRVNMKFQKTSVDADEGVVLDPSQSAKKTWPDLVNQPLLGIRQSTLSLYVLLNPN